MAGGLGDAGPADDAKVRAWAVAAARRCREAVAAGRRGRADARLAGRVAATGRVTPEERRASSFGSFVLLSTALVAPRARPVARQKARSRR